MKRIFIICAILLAVFAVLTSCASASQAGKADNNDTNAEQKEAKPTSYNFNPREFELSLQGNPSTGYKWKYEITEGKDVIEYVNQRFKSNATSSFMVGVGGTFTFIFKPLKAGDAVIQFRYARAIEWDPPIETRDVYVSVDEAGNVTVRGNGD